MKIYLTYGGVIMQIFEIRNRTKTFYASIFAKDTNDACTFVWSVVSKKNHLLIKQLNKKSPILKEAK